MSYQSRSLKKVYYHIVKGSRYILADERNKKKLLDIVLGIYKENDWEVCAFCVTDDGMYFVTEAREQDAVRHETKRAIDEFVSLKELDSMEAVAKYCREIHQLPVKAGYVNRIEDYWWSSYQTYAGTYDWNAVDCRLFLHFFSLNPETARQKLLYFHQ